MNIFLFFGMGKRGSHPIVPMTVPELLQMTGEANTECGTVDTVKKIRFDVIATSPLTRANQTAEIVARTLGEKNRLEVWDDLAPAAIRIRFAITLHSMAGMLQPLSSGTNSIIHANRPDHKRWKFSISCPCQKRSCKNMNYSFNERPAISSGCSRHGR